PIQTHFKVMKRKSLFIGVAGFLVLASIITLFVKPFNYGIDFTGGVLLEIKTKEVANIEDLRSKLKSFSPQIQSQGTTGDIVSIYLPQGTKTEVEISTDLVSVKNILGESVEYRNTQIVGPKVGSDLIKNGTLAVIISIFVISLYIWIRFELPFAIGAGLSLFHDIILALAMLCITGIEFDLTTLAALLTLAGYSINDTVVIYDRVRENLKKYKSKSLSDVIDLSINETVSRTILTSITTLFAILAIYIFGGEVLRGFSAVMLFGVIIGTYSSMFLSTSSLLLFKKSQMK
ncbi:MAG: protein translocase subunit SecF, partial [Alphaproteobacteria bacterium]|nr:protein translocase subunit SecF [Alphaproteobacteria bacterium]